jgi:hypothetical protein
LKVDWNNLPVDRDPSKTEYNYGSYGGGWGSEYDYDYDYGYKTWTKPTTPVDRTEKTWFHDAKFNYVSSVEINTLTKRVVSVDLCKERIALEQEMIDKVLVQLELHYIKSEWDGFKLKVYYEFDHSSDCDRNDLIEYLPVLDYKEIEELKDYGDEVFSKVESKLKPINKPTYRPVDNDSISGYCEDLYD